MKNVLRSLAITAFFIAHQQEAKAQSCNCTSVYENPGFESPSIGSGYRILNQNLVPGWSTTASDQMMELWYSGFHGHQTFNFQAAEGSQFIELNANQVGHIYQALCLEPGTIFNWSIYHRGRSGVDVATVAFGSSINSALVVKTMSSGNTSWVQYSGTYVVPAGQTTTYVVISSVSSVGGSTYGNLIDGFDLQITHNPCTDADADGVPDTFDEYPSDAGKAFNNYYPAGGSGTLMFEDLWPWKGDYDFNDVVVDYRFNTITNAQNKIVETRAEFKLRASGAEYNNGFGFQLPNSNISQSDILVSGYDLQNGLVNVTSNGLESGQSLPTIMVFDNFFNLMPRSGYLGTNTDPNKPLVPAAIVNILMTYRPNTYTLSDLNIGKFNPFIFVNQNRGREVHLANYMPTDKADVSMLGTGQDDSKMQNGSFYKTDDNLPWALNVVESIPYPKEQVQIIEAFTKFAQWAQSGGQLHTDWYLETGNNRVRENLYP